MAGLNFFDESIFGDEDERIIPALFGFGAGERRGNAFFRPDRQKVHGGLSFGGALSFRNFEHFELEDFSARSEQEQVVMGSAGDEIFHRVLLFGFKSDGSFASALLRAVFFGIGALDVAALRERHHGFALRNQ